MRKKNGSRTIAGRVRSTATSRGGDGRGRAVLGLFVCLPLLAAASSAWTQSSSFSWDEARAAQHEIEVGAASGSDAVSALAAYATSVSGREASSDDAREAEVVHDPAFRPLLAYVREISGEQRQLV